MSLRCCIAPTTEPERVVASAVLKTRTERTPQDGVTILPNTDGKKTSHIARASSSSVGTNREDKSDRDNELFFVGRWKVTKTEGQFEQFLRDRGVPLPVRKVLAFVASGGRFEYRVVDGKYVETELGSFANKQHKPVPLDGVTGVDDVAPSGERIKKYAKLAENKLILTNVCRGGTDDCVDSVVWFEKNTGALRKKITNRATGASFTSTMVPIDVDASSNNNGSRPRVNGRSTTSANRAAPNGAAKEAQDGADGFNDSASTTTTTMPGLPNPTPSRRTAVGVVVDLVLLALVAVFVKTLFGAVTRVGFRAASTGVAAVMSAFANGFDVLDFLVRSIGTKLVQHAA